jgi:glycosyltransferase involved in cell wall biosynthesis
MGLDVLIVSLGSTSGLRAADGELRDALRRAGAEVELVGVVAPAEVRTLMLTDLSWALAARRAASAALQRTEARAVIYSSTTSALLWPRPGAIRFDAPAAGNRPGRHGYWQRPLERRRLREAPLMLPWSAEALAEMGSASTGAGAASATAPTRALVLPVPVEPSGPPAAKRDIAAITYAANPIKKGLDRVLEAWGRVRRPGEDLVVAGASPADLERAGLAPSSEGVRVSGMLSPIEYRALLRRARVFVTAPRREDYGVAQLEALVDGCQLVSTPAPGPYVALTIARELDPRLVGEDLGAALRAALDDPLNDYAARAATALTPFRREAVDRVVAEDLLARLIPSR